MAAGRGTSRVARPRRRRRGRSPPPRARVEMQRAGENPDAREPNHDRRASSHHARVSGRRHTTSSTERNSCFGQLSRAPLRATIAKKRPRVVSPMRRAETTTYHAEARRAHGRRGRQYSRGARWSHRWSHGPTGGAGKEEGGWERTDGPHDGPCLDRRALAAEREAPQASTSAHEVYGHVWWGPVKSSGSQHGVTAYAYGKSKETRRANPHFFRKRDV